MDGDVGDFDLSAAYVRKAQGDLQAFMEGLAARLEPALPNAVTVTRKRRSLFSNATRTTAIVLTTDTGLLTLSLDQGRLEARRTKVVRGVSIGSQVISVPAWLEELTRMTAVAGADAQASQASLYAFLMS